jgi:hypothetical protein
MLKTYGVLTSSGIQKRYFEACWRRKKVVCYQELMLIEPEKPEWSKTEIIKSSINNINVIGKEENVIGKEEKYSKNSQSKVKESKVNINTAKPEPDGSKNLPATQSNKVLSALKDDLANYWQTILTSQQPHQTWSNYGKERKACTTLAQKTRALMQVTPFDSETELADAMFSMFRRMRQNQRADYWARAPATPSSVLTRWDALSAALADEYQSAEAAAKYDVEVPL